MNALLRDADRAILGTDMMMDRPDGTRTLVPIGTQPGASLVPMSAAAYAHWHALTLPDGEVMALWEDGTIGVLIYAPTATAAQPDPAATIMDTADTPPSAEEVGPSAT